MADREAAVAAIQAELGTAITSLLTTAELNAAIGRASSNGDIDTWLGCAEVCATLGRRARTSGSVMRWSADGVDVTRTAADWASVEAEFRALAAGGDSGFAFEVAP